MKRLILSTVCILLCATGLWAQTLVDGIYYNFDASTQTASVTNKSGGYSSGSNSYSGSITIPSTVAYNGTSYSVTSIGSYAFYNCDGLTSVTIPNSVTSIGDYYAFYNCTGLTSITIPNSVTSIGNGAFMNCSGLTSVTIPNSVTTIKNNTFENCSGLTSVTIPNSVTSIGSYAFSGCGIPVYNAHIFAHLPESYSGKYSIPDGIETIVSGAFSNCRELTSVTIPNSVTSIGSFAFYDCSGLTSITIPNSVTSIGSYAFSGCTGLTSVTIPNSVTSIAEWAFRGCGIPVYNAHIFAHLPESYSGKYSIPDGIETIVSGAFSNCSGLTSVTIPNSVTSIGRDAFYNCSGLTSITIPNSVTTIENNTFKNCSGLTSITIPNSVTTIESSAFYGCTGLTSVTIPNSVTSIESHAFYGCTGLTSVTIGNGVTRMGSHVFDGTAWFNNQPDGLVYAGKIAYEYKGPKPNYGTSIVLKDGTLGIADFAFNNCTRLTSVTIPNSVTSIGSSVFSNCSGLTSITIPNSVTSIGSSAFYDCSRLTSVTIGNGVTSMGSHVFDGTAWFNNQPDGLVYAGKIAYEYKGPKPNYGTSIVLKDGTLGIAGFAFNNCTGLTSVTIPNSVTSIGSCAFSGCSGLTSVTIPNSVTSIGSSAFADCSGLTSVTIPNSVTTIESSAFYDCSRLTSVTIGNGVTSMGSLVFYDCSGLTSITIPNSVTSIGDDAFAYCSGLTSIIVPCEKHDYFVGMLSEYAAIIYENCTFEVAVNANNENYGTATGDGVYNYAKSIVLTATPNDHYHFVKWNDGNTDNPRTVQVTQDSTFVAVFAIDEHNVTISKNLSAAGTVTGDGVYEYGTNITLTATANEGYRFKGWGDGVTDASREITVTKDTSITANFVALYTIKALASASQGMIIGGGVYEDGETVTLVANPKPGYIFAQWVDGSDENPRNVTVNGNKTYTAYFIEGEQDKYMITWKNWDGRVIKTSEVSYGEVPVFNGEKPTRPDEAGYTFTFNGWSPTIAAASQNAEYTANYIQTATEAEKTTIENEGDISITTTDNTALFTWPENASADTYTLTITRNDEVFCSLTFDGQGRLINLNFPNLRASAEGYQFTVTGLNSGTDYAYDLKAKNGAATVSEYTGEFRTSGDAATAAPEAEESIVETARYDINGRPLTAPTKGVNIVKYSDGSFEKEFVK